jgi:hypothetical protein
MNTHFDTDNIAFQFRYTFQNGTIKEFRLELDRHTLNLVHSPKPVTAPQWAELSYFQCPNCVLTADRHPFCPIALNLVDLIEAFKDSISYEEVEIIIITEARTYLKRTSLQKGLSSLLGIYMTTSGCPTMEKLKPMVQYHLPFATKEETLYRVISMYLFAQYFVSKRGGKPDWDLQDLVNLYREIKILNKRFSERLSHIGLKDASLNALTILDWFAENLTFSLDKDILDDIESFFEVYWTA